MDETMMNNVEEVTTDFTDESGSDLAIVDLPSTKPSKGFVTLVVGGVAALAVGAAVAIRRHKKKKAKAEADIEEEIDDGYDDLEDEEVDTETVDEEDIEVVETK